MMHKKVRQIEVLLKPLKCFKTNKPDQRQTTNRTESYSKICTRSNTRQYTIRITSKKQLLSNQNECLTRTIGHRLCLDTKFPTKDSVKSTLQPEKLNAMITKTTKYCGCKHKEPSIKQPALYIDYKMLHL